MKIWEEVFYTKVSFFSFKKSGKTQPAFTCSKLTVEKLEQGVKYVFIVNFEHILHLVLVGVFLLTLSKYLSAKFRGIFHDVKSVQIRSSFWSVFSVIRTEYGKIRNRRNYVSRHFPRNVL